MPTLVKNLFFFFVIFNSIFLYKKLDMPKMSIFQNHKILSKLIKNKNTYKHLHIYFY